MEEEILQCFDEQKNLTIGRPRSIVITPPLYKFWHGVSNIWVVNNKGQILCSKRAPLPFKTNPNKWQSYFGGCLTAGNTFKENAVKELGEEAGIVANENDLSFIDEGTHPEQKKFYENFAILYNKPTIDLSIADGEISEVRWMDLDIYWQEREANPNNWCNACHPHQQKLIRQWLVTKIKS
jgi:isopentenyldiphosphate isomerase